MWWDNPDSGKTSAEAGSRNEAVGPMSENGDVLPSSR